jgi:magnesium transporter
MGLLPAEEARRVQAIMSEREADARDLMSSEFYTASREAKVGEVLKDIRTNKREHDAITYIYVISPEKTLHGVVDLRELVLAGDEQTMGDLMGSPVVSADDDDVREDIAELFAKYHYRMLPVVDKQDHLLGVVRYNDIMKGLVTRAKI